MDQDEPGRGVYSFEDPDGAIPIGSGGLVYRVGYFRRSSNTALDDPFQCFTTKWDAARKVFVHVTQ